MSQAYRELAERIRNELDDLSQLINRAQASWESRRRFPDDPEIPLDSVALNLHGFYSGLERLFHLMPATLTSLYRKGTCGTPTCSIK